MATTHDMWGRAFLAAVALLEFLLLVFVGCVKMGWFLEKRLLSWRIVGVFRSGWRFAKWCKE